MMYYVDDSNLNLTDKVHLKKKTKQLVYIRCKSILVWNCIHLSHLFPNCCKPALRIIFIGFFYHIWLLLGLLTLFWQI